MALKFFHVVPGLPRTLLLLSNSIFPNHNCPKSKSPKLALQNWMLPLAVFQDWVGAIFTKKRVLTRQIAKGIMRGDADYDSTPATEVLGIDWIDVDTTIKDTVEAYQ